MRKPWQVCCFHGGLNWMVIWIILFHRLNLISILIRFFQFTKGRLGSQMAWLAKYPPHIFWVVCKHLHSTKPYPNNVFGGEGKPSSIFPVWHRHFCLLKTQSSTQLRKQAPSRHMAWFYATSGPACMASAPPFQDTNWQASSFTTRKVSLLYTKTSLCSPGFRLNC